MHHGRLCALVLDCKVDDLADAARFWSATLGKAIVALDQDGGGRYAELRTADDEPLILLQKVEHESCVHLDIETDDLEAEVAQLKRLGAHRIAFVRQRWRVMEAPSGQRFCSVRKQRELFGPYLKLPGLIRFRGRSGSPASPATAPHRAA